jgi:cellulose 1,4-beta-cellobiosidase
MAITVPSAGRYNASYDNWIGTAATSASSAGTLEQMIWLNYRDTTPIGAKVASAVTLAGATWDVWYGTHDGFRTVSYIRTNTNSMTFDINDFMKDTITRGYAKTSDFLLGIQAGFEIWEGSGAGFSVDSFEVSVK